MVTIQDIQNRITNKGDLREIVNQLADYIEANPGGGSSYLVAEVTLTDAQIKTLPTIPIEIIPAPGVGKYINMISAVMNSNTATGAYTNINADGRINLSYDNGSIIAGLCGVLGSTVNAEIVTIPPITFTDSGSWATYNVSSSVFQSGVVNKNLSIIISNAASGNLTGGNTANTLKITVYYTIVDL